MAVTMGYGPTEVDANDVHGIGNTYNDRGKTYRWVKLVDQDGLAGEVVYPASATTWDVTTDFTGGSGVMSKVCGVLLGAVDISEAAYCWVQIAGIAAVRTDAGVSESDALVGHSVDGEADTMADGEEELVFGFATEDDGTTRISGLDSVNAILDIAA